MNRVSGCPPEHKVPDWQENNAEEGRDKAMFWGPEAIFLDVGNEVPELVHKEASHSQQAGDPNGEEAEAYFADIEMIDGRVDQWENLCKR
jgi:hypothetical protein